MIQNDIGRCCPIRVDPAQIKEAVWLWATKQSMEMAKQQMDQTLQAVAKVTEPGKGTVLDVRV